MHMAQAKPSASFVHSVEVALWCTVLQVHSSVE
jgi:hypothetical protein